jgi:hypothetical protein
MAGKILTKRMIKGNIMLKLKIPKEIDLKLKKEKYLEKIIKIRMEREISGKIKHDLFLLMMFDKLLEESDLTEKDIDDIDHKVKRGIMESTGWK